MVRIAGIMSVNKGCFDEYERRHSELWPEMEAELKKHGASNYSIFLEQDTGKLFAYLEVESEEKWAQMSGTEICAKWWAYMADIMETNPDNSPVYKELKSVFYLA